MQIQMKGIAKAVRGAMLGSVVAATAFSAQAVEFIGLTNVGSLVRFDSATPGMVSSPLAVMGLGVDERLLGIDLRPTTGMLYGVSNQSNIYTVDALTGAATKVGALTNNVGGTPVTIGANPGTPPAIGIDFNPAADLAGGANARSLRITTSDGGNLAVIGTTGNTVVATGLTVGGATKTGVLSVAYSNNDINPATGTTLYYIDDATNALYKNVTPGNFNNGMIELVGSLGFDFTGVGGFDIVGANTAFASLVANDGAGLDQLYSINLSTGQATALGMIGADASLIGMTAAVAPVPEPETYALMLGGLGMLAFLGRRRQQRGSQAA